MMGRLIEHWLKKHSAPRATISRSLMFRSVAGCGALVLAGVGAYAGIIQPA